MQYEQFCEIFNRHIFERAKPDLLKKVADYPDRYTGLFRPTKPRAKLLQNLLQSNEIRFGDAFETWIGKQLQHKGWTPLPKAVLTVNKQRLSIDQLMQKDDEVLFIEQKVRDDHDSAKKRGQVTNFETKLLFLASEYQGKTITSYFYFIDPSMHKNANYYRVELAELARKNNLEVTLAYGSELYDNLGMQAEWAQNLEWLKQWKRDLDELPDIDFDENAQITFEEIKDLPLPIFRKLFTNTAITEAILPVLFPDNAVPKLLRAYFAQESSTAHKNIVRLIDGYL